MRPTPLPRDSVTGDKPHLVAAPFPRIRTGPGSHWHRYPPLGWQRLNVIYGANHDEDYTEDEGNGTVTPAYPTETIHFVPQDSVAPPAFFRSSLQSVAVSWGLIPTFISLRAPVRPVLILIVLLQARSEDSVGRDDSVEDGEETGSYFLEFPGSRTSTVIQGDGAASLETSFNKSSAVAFGSKNCGPCLRFIVQRSPPELANVRQLQEGVNPVPSAQWCDVVKDLVEDLNGDPEDGATLPGRARIALIIFSGMLDKRLRRRASGFPCLISASVSV